MRGEFVSLRLWNALVVAGMRWVHPKNVYTRPLTPYFQERERFCDKAWGIAALKLSLASPPLGFVPKTDLSSTGQDE